MFLSNSNKSVRYFLRCIVTHSQTFLSVKQVHTYSWIQQHSFTFFQIASKDGNVLFMLRERSILLSQNLHIIKLFLTNWLTSKIFHFLALSVQGWSIFMYRSIVLFTFLLRGWWMNEGGCSYIISFVIRWFGNTTKTLSYT